MLQLGLHIYQPTCCRKQPIHTYLGPGTDPGHMICPYHTSRRVFLSWCFSAASHLIVCSLTPGLPWWMLQQAGWSVTALALHTAVQH